jgi:hypothetical protein
VVEVLSLSTGTPDRGVMQTLGARAGVPGDGIVDLAARTVQALGLGGASYGAVAAVPAALPPLPGLTLDPAAVWPELTATAAPTPAARPPRAPRTSPT